MTIPLQGRTDYPHRPIAEYLWFRLQSLRTNGTIEVIKKVIVKKAIGAIATHDIEVCLTTNEYPNTLTNKCFEVEIKEDELHFDYKLRNGICKNKSATFLMKKMGVI